MKLEELKAQYELEILDPENEVGVYRCKICEWRTTTEYFMRTHILGHYNRQEWKPDSEKGKEEGLRDKEDGTEKH